jgi:hypothetical protein
LDWSHDYKLAMNEAKLSGRMLLVLFGDASTTPGFDRFEAALRDDEVGLLLGHFVVCHVLPSTEVMLGGRSQRLLSHAAFAELHDGPGLAIIDLTDRSSPFWGRVVSIYPFTDGGIPTAEQMRVLLTLPPGSLTQRTLIFAVRTHPESPRSADSEFSPLLAEETEKHSTHQAQIVSQGHHNWETRFHQINARLQSELVVQEVCAESWPGEGLLKAARECVRSWRHSSGHWSAVNAKSVYYGYDMKRGRNGVWYATGIFAHRR